MKNEDRRPYRINGKEIVIAAENANYANAAMSGVGNVKDALDYLKENGGGGGGGLQPTDIINDLTTGGTDKALSAEMGKELNEAINDKLSEVIVNSLEPGDTAIINDLTTGGSTNVLSAEQGKVLKNTKQPRMDVFVAASNAPTWQKAGADYVCDGTNDEVELQAAINSIQSTGGRIRLSMGDFYLDALTNTRTDWDFEGTYKLGLVLPETNNGVEFIIEGDTMPFRVFTPPPCAGTTIHMSNALYESLSDASNERYAIFGPAKASGYVSLQMRNIRFMLPWNGKKITCVDLLKIERVSLQYVECVGYTYGYNQNFDYSGVPMAAEHCIGIRSVGGSNWGTCADYKNTMVTGFYEGYQLAGEHIVGINMAAIGNYYGYTFGNFNYTNISCHTMTLINCSDEQAACGPKFVKCNQYQDVHIIGWNEERSPARTPGGVRVQNATCDPSSANAMNFRGFITYAIMGTNLQSNVALPFWEAGHGANFVTRNSTHKNAASWSEISSYKGDLGEIIYDTTNNRLVVCTAVSASGTTWRAMATTSV